MDKIDQSAIWELVEVLDAGAKQSSTSSRVAKVSRIDTDGTIWARLAGSNIDTPLASVATTVEVGDTVSVAIGNKKAVGEANLTSPAASTVYVGGAIAPIAKAANTATQAAEASRTVADEAKAVAEATNQHFWDDDNGAHVTDDTREAWEEEYAKEDHGTLSEPTVEKPWYNQLIGSAGTLLRTGLRNLASWTRSGIAFFDGQGTEDENIVAQFGKDLAVIGKANESHLELDFRGMKVIDDEDTTFFRVGDWRNADGTLTDIFIQAPDEGGILSSEFALTTPADTVAGIDVILDGEEVESFTLWIDYDSSGKEIGFGIALDTAPQEGAILTVRYTPINPSILKALTFGSRSTVHPIGSYSAAIGKDVIATGPYSLAEGVGTYAVAEGAHAEGYNSRALGQYSHAEGSSSALGYCAHAEGASEADSAWSHAEGSECSTGIDGRFAHAEGYNSHAYGEASHAGGIGNEAWEMGQTVIGRYATYVSSTALIIGNGEPNARSNALQLGWDGNLTIAGQINTSAIPNLAASKITSGTFATDRIPNLAASKITSGTLALARGGTASDNTARAINTFFAGPSSGDAGNASWRKLVAADLPTVTVAKGGTGATTAAAALKNIMAGKKVLYNGSAVNTSITLSETAASYNHMRIYFRVGAATNSATAPDQSVDIYSPNGKYVTLQAARYVSSSTTASAVFAVYRVNGTALARNNGGYLNGKGATLGSGTSTEIYVYRVEAWNE